MRLRTLRSAFPLPVWALLALYFIASLAHFGHNAEYLADYPNLPPSITRAGVYAVWFGQTAIGVLGIVLAMLRRRVAAALLIGVYGAFGLDGLLHYTVALASEHTWVANLTIGAEASLGVLLLLTSAIVCVRQVVAGPKAAGLS